MRHVCMDISVCIFILIFLVNKYYCNRIGCNYSHPAGRPIGYPVSFMCNRGKYNKKQNKKEQQ